ncbi:hypothetical protein BBJ28_00010011 [Nothophytophthora sp. Chile5]|nr:hypothetical protein BBJ28_00010011 [Nothophytophthora sp. Chile5]
MVQFFAFAAAVASAAFSTAAAATVADTCVITDFTKTASDFIGLNNVLTLIPTLLPTYIDDPFIIENQTLSDIDFSILNLDFTATPSFELLNLTGLTTIAPKSANVTGSNTLDLGTSFTGEVSLSGTFSVEITQLNLKWYSICWTSFWHQSSCPPATVTVDVTLALAQPTLVAGIEADMYECAPGIATSVCSNITMTTILVSALSGDLTTVLDSVLLHFKDASLTSLSLGWNAVTNIDFAFHDSSTLIKDLINALLDFSVKTLNKKGEIYDTFIAVVDKLILSLLNNLITSDLEPLFGATCLA